LTMTERWVSNKKYYCKYCNAWAPDTKFGRATHEASDRHKNAMTREVRRIQREEQIKRHADPALAAQAPRAGGVEMRGGPKGGNTAAYGYGEDADVAAYIAQAKRDWKAEDVPGKGIVRLAPVEEREGKIGKWTVKKVISRKEEPLEEDVKKEEDGEGETEGGVKGAVGGGTVGDGGKRERARSPDEEDLLRFKVQEKTFPVDVKDEDDVKVPTIGFKKRKIGAKNSRVSGAL
jgi:U1 zinc finger